MAAPLSGPGIGLPLPSNLYPSELNNAPYDYQSPVLALAPGQSMVIPAGVWFIDVGKYAVKQWLDPVTNTWKGFSSARDQVGRIKSDGFTYRVANLTGCPVAAIVTGAGSGYPQTGTTVTSSGSGGSTWSPIVGGAVSVVSVTAVGAGYGIAPLVLIQQPAQGNVPAEGYATISAGTVSGVTLTNVGAGYATAPQAVLLPSPFDPNIASGITQASVTLGLTASGEITAVLCTNNGQSSSTATAPTLTATGTGGSGATIAAVMMSTVISGSVAAGGFGYGTAGITTVGGIPSQTEASGLANPNTDLTTYTPRPAQIGLTVTAGSITAIGTIYDGGLFTGPPIVGIIGDNGTPTSTAANITLNLGNANSSVTLQPAP